jgi:hypothetical protein
MVKIEASIYGLLMVLFPVIMFHEVTHKETGLRPFMQNYRHCACTMKCDKFLRPPFLFYSKIRVTL